MSVTPNPHRRPQRPANAWHFRVTQLAQRGLLTLLLFGVPLTAHAAAQAPAGIAAPAPGSMSQEATPPSPAATATAPSKKAKKPPKPLYEEGVPLLALLVIITLVLKRLPKVDVGHSPAFLRRRMQNWIPLGLTYAFLYMARYNLAVAKSIGSISVEDFGYIDGWGSIVYGVSFLINGPLTDRWGGRRTILIAAAGAIVANIAIGVAMLGDTYPSVKLLTLLFSLNMYFQSFGAVSIVKVNASWFHIKERGTFGGIFGILISLGLYFAYDGGRRIAAMTCGYDVDVHTPAPWLFFAPSIILGVFWILSLRWVQDTPAQAGFADFDPEDASSGESTAKVSAAAVIKRMMTNPIILTIAFIELCSGFLRQGILKWYQDFAVGTGGATSFVNEHWGMVSAAAGITGGVFAGVISDYVFNHRRAPVASVLYGIMLAGAVGIMVLLRAPFAIAWVVAIMAMAIIGVHGMLSGVASQDFGGKNHAGIATGLIDGFVYLGSAAQSFFYGAMLPAKGSAEAQVAANWIAWPVAMIPVALVGLLLALRMWHAVPKKAGH